MFIKKVKNKHDNTHRLYLAESYRNTSGKPRHRLLKSYGVLETLIKDNPNILEDLKQEAKRLSEEREKTQTIKIDFERLQEKRVLNYGYIALESVYNRLNIQPFIKNYESKKKIRYSIDEILRLLVYSRSLNPASKQGTYHERTRYYNRFGNIKLQEVYKALDALYDMRDDLLLHVHQSIEKTWGRNCDLVFYDVTNYYFESAVLDGLRQRGVSKENKDTGLVQMGLFIDKEGIPITYELFPGNTNDMATMKPILTKIKEKYNLGAITVVADKGNNSGENLATINNNQDYYIVSQKIRGRKRAFKELILDEKGYQYNKAKTFKAKKVYRERQVKRHDGSQETIKENLLCFWSQKEQDYQRQKRGHIEERIEKYKNKPALLNASNSFGVKKYFKKVAIDPETGEVTKAKHEYVFDEEKYNLDMALDGYYAIVTNDLDLEAHDIIGSYKQLSIIEDSFRVTKTDLEGRPVYVWTDDHIEAHFLTCFLSLTLYRLLQCSLDRPVPVHQIKHALNSTQLIELEQGIFKMNQSEPLFKTITEKLHKLSIENSYYKEEDFSTLLKTMK